MVAELSLSREDGRDKKHMAMGENLKAYAVMAASAALLAISTGVKLGDGVAQAAIPARIAIEV